MWQQRGARVARARCSRLRACSAKQPVGEPVSSFEFPLSGAGESFADMRRFLYPLAGASEWNQWFRAEGPQGPGGIGREVPAGPRSNLGGDGAQFRRSGQAPPGRACTAGVRGRGKWCLVIVIEESADISIWRGRCQEKKRRKGADFDRRRRSSWLMKADLLRTKTKALANARAFISKVLNYVARHNAILRESLTKSKSNFPNHVNAVAIVCNLAWGRIPENRWLISAH
jgi:hypothetical protein